jgi:hypothetical protein
MKNIQFLKSGFLFRFNHFERSEKKGSANPPVGGDAGSYLKTPSRSDGV